MKARRIGYLDRDLSWVSSYISYLLNHHKVHLLYEPGNFTPSIGKLTEENTCMYVTVGK
jgi:hypothetical protein